MEYKRNTYKSVCNTKVFRKGFKLYNEWQKIHYFLELNTGFFNIPFTVYNVKFKNTFIVVYYNYICSIQA